MPHMFVANIKQSKTPKPNAAPSETILQPVCCDEQIHDRLLGNYNSI